MRVALWIGLKVVVFGIAVWTWYEIDSIEAGMVHGGRAKIAVLAIAVIGTILLSPVEPMVKWNKKDND